MNKDTLKGDWKLIKGKIKEKWGKFTDDDLTEINGKREQLLGKIQKKYGLAKEEAEQELDEWEKRSENHSINEEVNESEDEREIRHTKH